MAVKARRHRFEKEIIKNPPQLEPVWRLAGVTSLIAKCYMSSDLAGKTPLRDF